MARTMERTLGGQLTHPWNSVSTIKADATGPNLLDDINHVSLKSIALGPLGIPLPVSRVLRGRRARVRLSSSWSVEADNTKTTPSGDIFEVDRGVSVRVQPLQVRRASGERLPTQETVTCNKHLNTRAQIQYMVTHDPLDKRTPSA